MRVVAEGEEEEEGEDDDDDEQRERAKKELEDEDEQTVKQKLQKMGLSLLKSVGTRASAISEPEEAATADLPAFVFDNPPVYAG